MIRIWLIGIGLAAAVACNPSQPSLIGERPPAAPSAATTEGPAAASIPSPTPDSRPAIVETTTTGLIINGNVRLENGTPLANVQICRNFAAYNGKTVAVTDERGRYEAALAFIPGIETIGVWPKLAGYTFDPPFYNWVHYYGLETRTLDFIAKRSDGTPGPPFPVECDP